MTWPAEEGELPAGVWLHRETPPPAPHVCMPPMRYEAYNTGPDGQPGDVWQCATCRTVLVIKRKRGVLWWCQMSKLRARRIVKAKVGLS